MKTLTRIEERFTALQKQKSKGFITYITAGDPDLPQTLERVLRLEQAGVDVVELGIPFSDPLADGPTNQHSAERALRAGVSLEGVLDCVADIRKRSQIPLMLYSYVNLLEARGLEKSVRAMAEAGVDGLLLLDVACEEAAPYQAMLSKYNLNYIGLVAPTSTDERIAKIAALTSGFIYCISREGVTGVQQGLSPQAGKLLRRVKKLTALPRALGFGISSPAQAHEASRQAEAIVVGSAIVQRFHDEDPRGRKMEQTVKWVKSLVEATKA